MELLLRRTYFAQGTNGLLLCGGRVLCLTIELPWKENARLVSCIPEGRYTLRPRINRKFGRHLEVRGVPGRSLILIHPANDAQAELNGCIAPVSRLTGAGTGTGSRAAFNTLMLQAYAAAAQGEPLQLHITS